MADPFTSEVGERIRQLRTTVGLTQQQLADAIGMSRVSITNLETGRQNIPLDRLGHIADALGVPAGALVGEVDLDAMRAAIAEAAASEWSRRYAQAVYVARDRLREAASAVATLQRMVAAGLAEAVESATPETYGDGS